MDTGGQRVAQYQVEYTVWAAAISYQVKALPLRVRQRVPGHLTCCLVNHLVGSTKHSDVAVCAIGDRSPMEGPLSKQRITIETLKPSRTQAVLDELKRIQNTDGRFVDASLLSTTGEAQRIDRQV